MAESPAETLRRAAKLMRERAEAACPGPWDFETEVGGFGPVAYVMVPLSPHHPGVQTGLTRYMPLGSQDAETAEHIASWHPGVALAVADVLDNEAHAAELIGGDADAVNLPDERILKLARAYLGEAQP